MAGAPIIEIREPGRPVRRVVLDRAIEVGRECDGEVLSDEGVSRRHLRLVPRMEGELLLTALAQRVASIELAGPPTRHFNNAVRGFASLPLEVRAA